MRVYVIDSENRASPPVVLISRTCGQIDEGSTRFQAAERRALAAINQLKAKLAVECNGSRHVADSERHRADGLDHIQLFSSQVYATSTIMHTQDHVVAWLRLPISRLITSPRPTAAARYPAAQ
jgi:hypothetical protein